MSKFLQLDIEFGNVLMSNDGIEPLKEFINKLDDKSKSRYKPIIETYFSKEDIDMSNVKVCPESFVSIRDIIGNGNEEPKKYLLSYKVISFIIENIVDKRIVNNESVDKLRDLIMGNKGSADMVSKYVSYMSNKPLGISKSIAESMAKDTPEYIYATDNEIAPYMPKYRLLLRDILNSQYGNEYFNEAFVKFYNERLTSMDTIAKEDYKDNIGKAMKLNSRIAALIYKEDESVPIINTHNEVAFDAMYKSLTTSVNDLFANINKILIMLKEQDKKIKELEKKVTDLSK